MKGREMGEIYPTSEDMQAADEALGPDLTVFDSTRIKLALAIADARRNGFESGKTNITINSWRSISSFENDGKAVDLWFEGGYKETGYRYENCGWVEEKKMWVRPFWIGGCLKEFIPIKEYPSHYMRIEAPHV